MVWLRRLFAIAALLALLAGLAMLLLLLWRPAVERQLDASWREQLGGATILDRYPRADDNAAASVLERLEAAIGIEPAPQEGEGHRRPTPEAAALFKAASEKLSASVDPSRLPVDGTFPPVAPEVAAYLDFARPVLERLSALLRRDPAPLWRRDLALGIMVPSLRSSGRWCCNGSSCWRRASAYAWG